jgi:hypothetical protein
LQLDEFDDRAEIISKMQIACRLDARKNPFYKFCHPGEAPKPVWHALLRRIATACWQACALRPDIPEQNSSKPGLRVLGSC